MRPGNLLGTFLTGSLLAAGGCGAAATHARAGHDVPARPAASARGVVRRVSFFSPALRERRSYLVDLPRGYTAAAAAGRRFPVLYLLHSAVGWPDRFIDAGHVDRALDRGYDAGRLRPMLVVMPDGRVRTGGPDTEWADTGLGPYEDALIDVVHAVDRRWRTVRRRSARMLAGPSTGGFAAANVALHHLGLFGGFESWSGYFRETRTDAFTTEPQANLDRNSPVDDVGRLRTRLRRQPTDAVAYEGDRGSDPAALDLF